tara:strand:+ start:10650 stop:11297 length:648 start_codon:yes stop_codon:yes gene_type:complete
MLYSRVNNWAFVHVPKNAGTSVEAPFVELRNPNFERERKRYRVKALIPKLQAHHNKWSYWSEHSELKELTPVALSRNPWDRALSIYTYNLKTTSQNLDQDWGRIDHGILTKQGFKKSWMDGGFFVDGHGKEFEYSNETDRAWGQDDDQYSWLEGEGKWFRIEDQWDEFCSFTKLPHPKKINTTTRGDYRNYYDDELAERIATLFARDVELGGYKF